MSRLTGQKEDRRRDYVRRENALLLRGHAMTNARPRNKNKIKK